MICSANLILLLCVIIMIIIYTGFRWLVLKHAHREVQQYRLYAIRDKITRLRIEDAYDSQKQYLFQLELCNSLIRNVREITLRNFLLYKKVDYKSEEIYNLRKFLRQESEPAKVLQTIAAALWSILIENSTLMRFVAYLDYDYGKGAQNYIESHIWLQVVMLYMAKQIVDKAENVEITIWDSQALNRRLL